ncbi:hypothetical protein BH20VER1_BH20VER1_25780 [soil metagenome]
MHLPTKLCFQFRRCRLLAGLRRGWCRIDSAHETKFREQVRSQTEFGNEPESLKLTGRAVRTIVGGRTVWM